MKDCGFKYSYGRLPTVGEPTVEILRVRPCAVSSFFIKFCIR
ncbi:hypothetical protein HMPREF9554_00102 [Treponema phagedenis F0421]|nr:hypothetical protein HMPREF9554_00102 [Treponema phagedenis F0421]